jgi:hypothetical protein
LDNIPGDELSYDPDHTKTAREFYVEFWGKTLSDSISDYDGAVGKYRSDTIISFNTIAGCMIRTTNYKGDMPPTNCQEKRLSIIKEHANDDMFKKFEDFFEVYHSLANFMPLVYESPWCINLNSVKGSPFNGLLGNGQTRKAFRDFPDLFFEDIRKYYCCGPDYAAEEFSFRYNEAYFAEFRKKGDGDAESRWVNFVEKNYLQDFFTGKDGSYLTFKQLSPDEYITMPYRQKKLSDEEKEKCEEQVSTFLKNAIEIIQARAKRLEKTAESIAQRCINISIIAKTTA